MQELEWREDLQNYKEYRLNWTEKLLSLAIAVSFAGVIAWLFYRNRYVVIGAVFLYLPVKKAVGSYFFRKRNNEMLTQFKEMLQMAATALKAGYAMENAFVCAREEFVRLYGEKTIMAKEFAYINHQAEWNIDG